MFHRIPRRMSYELPAEPAHVYTRTTKLFLLACAVIIAFSFWCFSRIEGSDEQNRKQCVDEMHGRLRDGVCYVDMKDFPKR